MSEIRANQIQNPAQDGGPVMVGLTTVSGDLHVTGFGTFLGLTVTGIATYEDVRHVDALGLSTFRAGLEANTVSGVSTFYRGTHLAVNTGNVGIGTDVPGSILDIQGNDPTITLTDTSGTNDVATIESLSGALRFTARDGNADGEVIFRKFDGTTQDETLRITNDGRLGVGTASPLRDLEVFNTGHATAALKGDTQSSLFFVDTADSNIGQISYLHADNDMFFRVNDAERLRINSSGQVGIASANPRKTMDVSGTACMNVNDLGNVNGNVTLNFNTNNNYVMTLTGTTAFLAPTGIATGQSGVIVLKQDGTGSRTATWDSSFKFKGGTAPTLSTGAGKSDAVAYFCHEPPYIIAGTFIGIGSA